MLRAHIERLFKQSKPGDFDLSTNKQEQTKPDEIDLKAIEQAKLVEKILGEVDDLPFLSINLEGFTDHLTTFVHGSHASPVATEGTLDSLFPPQVLQLFANSSADVTPYGRYLDFTHHRRDGRDNNFSPFKPVSAPSFVISYAKGIGDPRAGADNETERGRQVRSGSAGANNHGGPRQRPLASIHEQLHLVPVARPHQRGPLLC